MAETATDIGTPGNDNVTGTGLINALDAVSSALPNNLPNIVELSVSSEIEENGAVTLTGTFEDLDLGDIHTLEIDWEDPNDENPTMLELVPGEREFEFTHIYQDDGPTPGNDTLSDTATILVKVNDDSGAEDTQGVETLVKNVKPIIDPTIDVQVTVIDDDNGGDDNEGLLISIEGTLADPGNLDLHTGTVQWSDGVSVDLDDIILGDRTFTTSRFLSEEELEDSFTKIDDNDNNFPDENFPGELDEDDIYKLGVNISLEDDDIGMDTKPFELFVSEQGGAFVAEMV